MKKTIFALTIAITTAVSFTSCSDHNSEPRVYKTTFTQDDNRYHVFYTKGMHLDTVQVTDNGEIITLKQHLHETRRINR